MVPNSTDNFVGRQNVVWLAPLPPKRHNDVILEKIVCRRPLSNVDLSLGFNVFTSKVHLEYLFHMTEKFDKIHYKRCTAPLTLHVSMRGDTNICSGVGRGYNFSDPRRPKIATVNEWGPYPQHRAVDRVWISVPVTCCVSFTINNQRLGGLYLYRRILNLSSLLDCTDSSISCLPWLSGCDVSISYAVKQLAQARL